MIMPWKAEYEGMHMNNEPISSFTMAEMWKNALRNKYTQNSKIKIDLV